MRTISVSSLCCVAAAVCLSVPSVAQAELKTSRVFEAVQKEENITGITEKLGVKYFGTGTSQFGGAGGLTVDLNCTLKIPAGVQTKLLSEYRDELARVITAAGGTVGNGISLSKNGDEVRGFTIHYACGANAAVVRVDVEQRVKTRDQVLRMFCYEHELVPAKP